MKRIKKKRDLNCGKLMMESTMIRELIQGEVKKWRLRPRFESEKRLYCIKELMDKSL